MNAPPLRLSRFVAAILLTISALLAQEVAAPTPVDVTTAANSTPADYVVHEWGTFTSMADAHGVVLEGLHHEEEHLPAFVHDLSNIKDAGRVKGVKLPASYVTQKMETPVIYFYAEQPMRAQVRVWFTDGLMTQFYPLPATIFPRVAKARNALVDLRKVRGSMLTWDLDILARDALPKSPVPTVASDDPWHFARQTRANLVSTRSRPGTTAKTESEHYLFYRGLGRWQPAVIGAARRDGRLGFENRMAQAIPFCLALQLGKRGGRFAIGRAIAPAGDSAQFDLSQAEWTADRERFARRVGAEVHRALVGAGLYVDEARAMVATWSRSWLQSDGTRVIYLLPREQVDQVLPLTLTPRPREIVRVMVGRHEFITPEAQETVERALANRDAAAPEVAVAARRELDQLDRFLEPHLRNILRNGTTAASRQQAEAMLANQAQVLPPK